MIWPTGAQERLLRVVSSSPAEVLNALSGVDVRRLDPTSRRLLPLLYPILRDLDARGPLREEAEAEYRRTASRNAALFERGGALVRDLRSAGVTALALKGAALVASCYRDPGLRPMADLDLAVTLKALFPTLEVFQRAGWTPRYTLTPSLIRTRHAAPYTTRDGLACDLHWRIFAEPTPAAFEDELWAASVDADLQGTRIRVLSPADQLLHVCLHGLRWAPEPAVWWVGDAVRIIRAGGIDWDRIVSRAVRARFVLRLREALGYLHHRLGVAIPDDVLATLQARPVAAIERLEWRLIAREHRLLGELPTYWCHYRRTDERAGLLGFPAYLKDALRLKSAADLPRAAAGRALARLAAALRRRQAL
jgi:hypothetical protein